MSAGEMTDQRSAPEPRKNGSRFMDSSLNRLIVWAGALLLISVIGFGVYYYVDQSGSGSTGIEERELAAAEQAVRDDPTNITNRLVLADVYFKREDYEASVSQYREAIAIDEKSTLAHVGLGRALIETGNLDEAITNFQWIIDIAKEEDISGELVQASRYYLGTIALEQENWDEAVTQFKEATVLQRTDSDSWYLLGTAYLAAGKVDEAIEALGEAILFVPDYTEAYEALADAFERKGASPGIAYARGMAAYSEGDLGEASRLLESAITASPELSQAHTGLGLVRESQGDREGAIVAYQAAVDLNPDDFLAKGGLARLMENSSGELPPDHPDTTGGDGSSETSGDVPADHPDTTTGEGTTEGVTP